MYSKNSKGSNWVRSCKLLNARHWCPLGHGVAGIKETKVKEQLYWEGTTVPYSQPKPQSLNPHLRWWLFLNG